MPYPSTASLDTFDRADAADLGAAWTGSLWSGETIPEVNANTAYANGGARSAYWNAGTFPEDQEAWIVSNGNRALIDLRVTNPGGSVTCYEADFNTSTWSLNRIVAGSGTGAVASGSFTNAAGDVLGVTLIGTLFYVFQNGSVLASGSDQSPVLGAGYLGFEILTAARIREYGGGEITHPAAPTVRVVSTALRS